MTRIIGGTAGGRRLKTPRGDSTRPTSDRVREALFSSIDAWLGSLVGLRFLDLYAGSGAVGLEARSRGAGVVTLVEHDNRTAALIRDNIKTLGFTGVDVLASTVARAISAPARAPYDVVFIDPPYGLPTEEVTRVLEGLQTGSWVSPGAMVIVERSGRDGDFPWPGGYTSHRCKKYGETCLWYGHAAVPT